MLRVRCGQRRAHPAVSRQGGGRKGLWLRRSIPDGPAGSDSNPRRHNEKPLAGMIGEGLEKPSCGA